MENYELRMEQVLRLTVSDHLSYWAVMLLDGSVSPAGNPILYC